MRVVGEIPHPMCRITLLHWNNKYLVKMESGPLEQTFKISEFDITSEADLPKIVDTEFIKQAMERFADMSRSLGQAIDQL